MDDTSKNLLLKNSNGKIVIALASLMFPGLASVLLAANSELTAVPSNGDCEYIYINRKNSNAEQLYKSITSLNLQHNAYYPTKYMHERVIFGPLKDIYDQAAGNQAYLIGASFNKIITNDDDTLSFYADNEQVSRIQLVYITRVDTESVGRKYAIKVRAIATTKSNGTFDYTSSYNTVSLNPETIVDFDDIAIEVCYVGGTYSIDLTNSVGSVIKTVAGKIYQKIVFYTEYNQSDIYSTYEQPGNQNYIIKKYVSATPKYFE